MSRSNFGTSVATQTGGQADCRETRRQEPNSCVVAVLAIALAKPYFSRRFEGLIPLTRGGLVAENR